MVEHHGTQRIGSTQKRPWPHVLSRGYRSRHTFFTEYGYKDCPSLSRRTNPYLTHCSPLLVGRWCALCGNWVALHLWVPSELGSAIASHHPRTTHPHQITHLVYTSGPAEPAYTKLHLTTQMPWRPHSRWQHWTSLVPISKVNRAQRWPRGDAKKATLGISCKSETIAMQNTAHHYHHCPDLLSKEWRGTFVSRQPLALSPFASETSHSFWCDFWARLTEWAGGWLLAQAGGNPGPSTGWPRTEAYFSSAKSFMIIYPLKSPVFKPTANPTS